MTTTADPQEVHAIAGQLLVFLGEHVAASDEVIVAALNVAAKVMEETRAANVGAQVRANVLQQLFGKGKA